MKFAVLLTIVVLSTACGQDIDQFEGEPVPADTFADIKAAAERDSGVELPPLTYRFELGEGPDHTITVGDHAGTLGDTDLVRSRITVALTKELSCSSEGGLHPALSPDQVAGTALLHEMTHVILNEKYGDSDVNHTRAGWWYDSEQAFVYAHLHAWGYADLPMGEGCIK